MGFRLHERYLPVSRVISRARISTPPLAPLTNAKRSDSDENLAELDQFVAQLRAKRQMEHQLQQQQMMNQSRTTAVGVPGPQQYPVTSESGNDEDRPSAHTHLSESNVTLSPVQSGDSMVHSVSKDVGHDNANGDLISNDQSVNATLPCVSSSVSLPNFKDECETDAPTTVTVAESVEHTLPPVTESEEK